MVHPLLLRRATRLWLTRIDRKARNADLRVRCRVLLKVHAGQSPHHAAREIGCHPSTACRIVARFMTRGEGSLLAPLRIPVQPITAALLAGESPAPAIGQSAG